ncbi:MAG TPA: phage tail protein [Alphaproteobacteria bacterium]|nr:phage tail protein [Alphaproteobacteria bacterium]
MAGLIGGSAKTNATTAPAATSLRIQTSNTGMALPLVYGQTRVAGNLIWYDDFASTPVSSGGGGGGGKGGSAPSSTGSTSYDYTASVMFGICEGPVGGIETVWRDKDTISSDPSNVATVSSTASETYAVPPGLAVAVRNAASFVSDGGVVSGMAPLTAGASSNGYRVSAGTYTFTGDLAGTTVSITYSYTLSLQEPPLGFALVNGALGQPVWGYLSSVHPEAALGYNQIAYVACANYDLGDSASLPNHNFEILGLLAGTVAGVLDVNPADVVADYLIDPEHGTGFDPALLADLSTYRAYCQAAGLLVSPAYTDIETANDALERLATLTNSEFVWSEGKLDIVPYGDAALSANGAVYTPPSAPLYDLDDDDFLAIDNNDPVQLTRSRPADQMNSVQLEFCNRAIAYNIDIVEAKDEAQIALYGARPEQSLQAHEICDAGVARTSAQLWLQRQAVRNTYKFNLGWRYVLLDPMDIVTITDANLGLERQWVRITDIAEDSSGTLAVTAEEYLAGTGAAATYAFEITSGKGINPMVAPGNALAPVFIEPPDALTTSGLEVWIATAGGADWGGCDVWISTDDATYKLAGRFNGRSRMGTLTAALGAVAPAATGPTVDSSDTLAVDLSASAGVLLSGTEADALALDTLCFVDGELVAYASATQTAANAYALTYLARGAYGTTIAGHAAGAAFVRLDQGVFKYPYDASRIGQPIYVKLLSFNIFGGAEQSLADVSPYTYVPTGAALASPLPDVTGLVSAFVGGQTVLQWNPVADFRAVDYELRMGTSWAGARALPRTPLTSYPSQGDSTYWVAAHANPLTGLDVYSADPAAIAIAGSVLVRNVVASFDEAAAHWPGTVSGAAFVNSDGLELGSTGNILGVANLLTLADVIWYGGVAASGTYTFPASETVIVSRVASCAVNFGFTAYGVSIYDNVLAVPDILGVTDFLDAALGAQLSVQPQISLSQDGTSFAPWQNWVPGQYLARGFMAQILIASDDPQVRVVVSALTFLVDVPDRVDTGTAVAVPTSGLAVAYATPFNAVPNLQVTILSASAGDDAIVSGSTISGFSISIENGGAPAARSINWVAQGY